MNRTFCLTLAFASALAAGCHKSQVVVNSAQQPTAAQSATVSPAPPATMQAASPAPQQANAAKPGAMPLAGQGNKPLNLPPSVMEKLTRPLTREEIDRLPPEVRDTILRAQGKLPPTPAQKTSPAATPKK